MNTDKFLILAVALLLIGMGISSFTKDPWPLVCATIVFTAVYLERALLDRQELERTMDAQEIQIKALSTKDRDLDEIKTQINAIQLSLGMQRIR